jgi:hypothetical protein
MSFQKVQRIGKQVLLPTVMYTLQVCLLLSLGANGHLWPPANETLHQMVVDKRITLICTKSNSY